MRTKVRSGALVAVTLFAVLGTVACFPQAPSKPKTVVVNVSPTGVSPSSITLKAGQKVKINATGFTTTGNLGTRPPLAGQPGGVYVTFGRFANTWKPSAGAPSSARTIIEQLWALPPASYTALGGATGSFAMNPDGSFTATLSPVETPGSNPNYGIALYPGSGANNPAEEIFIPITFS